MYYIKEFNVFKKDSNSIFNTENYWFDVANNINYGWHGSLEEVEEDSRTYKMYIKMDEYTLYIYQLFKDINSNNIDKTTLRLINNKTKLESSKTINNLKMPNEPKELGRYISKFIPKLISETN